MIIPVVFSLAPVCEELIYSWSFYKGIDIVKHYGWPLFAQRQYFEEKETQREKGFYSEAVAKHNDMEYYSPADEAKYIQVMFPEELIQQYIEQFPSQTDAYVASLGNPWPQMTEFMVMKVRELEQKTGEKAEAFLCLCDTAFIRDAANQLNIDILHYEWAPLRSPTYRNTAYLDLTGNICDGELTARYEAFRQVSQELPLFNRREILAFFLNNDYLHYAYDADPEPEYEVGLGFGYNVPWIFNHLSQMTSAEMYTKAEKIFGDNILVRYHPSDPMHADLRRGVRDSGSLVEFMRKCRRIVCNTSGLAYEAMLFNRPAYEMGQSQYRYFTNQNLNELPDHIADDAFLSFIAFGYCIPFELLKSVQYLRWRLSRPSEKEIYMYHLNYYMNCLNVSASVVSLTEPDRLKAILEARQVDTGAICVEDEPLWMKSDEISRLHATIERYKRRVEVLEKENQDIRNQLNVIHAHTEELEATCNYMMTSKSWRITKPLRVFTRIFQFRRQE